MGLFYREMIVESIPCVAAWGMCGTEVVPVPFWVNIRHNEREKHTTDERYSALLNPGHTHENHLERVFGVDMDLRQEENSNEKVS
jgi:hypothetical protein